MFRKLKIMATLFTFVVIGAAFAAPSASAFGQCGGSVSTGSQLYNSWQAMGVTSQAAKVTKSAGFHRMDGSLKHWMEERVVKAKLASTASPEDFGCQPGTLFSVGHRTLAKGTSVMVALPLKYAKSDIRLSPCSRCKRIVISAKMVGKTDCSNPESGTVQVVVWVVKPKHHHPHHHPHHPHHPCKCHPKPKKPVQPSCEAMGMITVAGNCVEQHNNAEQNCKDNGGMWDSSKQLCSIIQVNGDCSNITVVNGSGNTVTTYQEGNCKTEIVEKPCNCEPPPPPCGCEPEKPKPPKLVVEWERIQEVYTNGTRNLCVTVTPAAGAEVQFGVKYGERSNGGKGVYNANTNKYCVAYTAPSEEPPHVCEEAISSSLPAGTKCDIANVMVTCKGCEPVLTKMEIPILKEESQVVW